MRLEDLMERAAQYDENLARDIKDYVHGRKYGLVYEASKPEFVRMWKKPVVRGDIVNILPPRGVMEDTKNEDDPSEIVYKVIAIFVNDLSLICQGVQFIILVPAQAVIQPDLHGSSFPLWRVPIAAHTIAHCFSNS